MKVSVPSFLSERYRAQTRQAGHRFIYTSENLQRIADRLRDDAFTAKAAAVLTYAATASEHISHVLQANDMNDAVQEVRNFAERQPWTFAATGFIIGLGTSRFMKAGKRHRASQMYVGAAV